MKKANFIIFAVFFIVIVAWIGVFSQYYFLNQETFPVAPSAVDKKKTELANPASVFCEEQGGKIEMQENEVGQASYCVFEDGKICEEWALFQEDKCVSPE